MKMLSKIKEYFLPKPPHIWVAMEALRNDVRELHADMCDANEEIRNILIAINELYEKIEQLKPSLKAKKDTKPEKPKPKKPRKAKE